MRKTWVLVADSARARFFTAETPKGPLTEFEDLVHPEARVHARDLTSDRPGRSFDRAGQGRHPMGSLNAAKEHEAEDFARAIASRLEAGRNAGQFEQIVVVAPPDFLGLLRKAIGHSTAKLISAEISKNLARRTPEAIRSMLPVYL
jgi:protein required for attachment to host cells